MNRINNDIKKNNFAHVYLLTGSEDYLRLQYRDKLTAALLGDGDKMNLSRYHGKSDPDEIIEMAHTLPFFAERRVIEISDSGFFKAGGEKLAEYFESPDENTFFVFEETEIDKRSKLYKAVSSEGYVAEFEKQDEPLLRKWIIQMAAKEELTIEPAVAAFLISRVGNDMFVLKNELNKCIFYCKDKGKIEREDVESVCVRELQDRIFEMMDQIAAGKKERALKLYYDLLSLKEPPVKILSLLSGQFRNLYTVKLMREKGMGKDKIASTIKVAPFVAGKLMSQASSFKVTTLRRAMEDAARAEEDIKTGKMQDAAALEMFMIKYSA